MANNIFPMSPADAQIEDFSMPVDPKAMSELSNDFDTLSKRKAEIDSQKESLDSNLSGIKSNLINEMFDMLERLGVDPSDPMSVKDFLNKLTEESPDLAELFEYFFDKLTADDSNSDNNFETMNNQNEELQQTI